MVPPMTLARWLSVQARRVRRMAIISVLHVEDHGDPEKGGSQGDEEEESDHWEAPWVEVREGAQTVDFGSLHRTQHWRSGRGASVSRQP
jgi:hypothetical protein